MMLRGGFVTVRAAAVESKQWNLIFPRGEWHGANLEPIGGSITIDDAMLAEMVANWEAAGKPPLPVRWTHSHLDEVDPVKRLELEQAAGLLTDMRITSQGLEVLTEWNPDGAADVRAGKWNFWSPEWQPKHVDRRTGEMRGWWLSGVALTNDPFFHSMPAVAASTTPTIPPAPGSPTGTNTKGKQMNYAKIAAALGMPEDSTEEAIIAKCGEMKAAMSPSQMQASLTAALKPVQEQLKETTEKLAVLEADKAKAVAALFERDVNDVIEKAKAEGYACEPMRAAVVLVAKASGLEEAAKLARSAAKLATTTTGTNQGNTTDVTASAKEYGLALDKFAKERSLTGSAAVKAFHREFPAMAKVASAPINPNRAE